MYIQINDGKALFATHLIKVELTEEQKALFPDTQYESEGLICYSEEEKTSVEEVLTSNDTIFTTEIIDQNPEHISKSRGIIYTSRTEAIRHLQEEVEPESQIIPNLKKRNRELEDSLVEHKERLNQAESALLTVMFNRKGG